MTGALLVIAATVFAAPSPMLIRADVRPINAHTVELPHLGPGLPEAAPMSFLASVMAQERPIEPQPASLDPLSEINPVSHYSSALTIRVPGEEKAAAVRGIVKTALAWISDKHPQEMKEARAVLALDTAGGKFESDGLRLRMRSWKNHADPARTFELIYTHGDHDRPERRWQTQVHVGPLRDEIQLNVNVGYWHENGEIIIPSWMENPNVPGFVSRVFRLVGRNSWSVFDGIERLVRTPHARTTADSAFFLDDLAHRGRRLPILYMSLDRFGNPALDPDALAWYFHGAARVTVPVDAYAGHSLRPITGDRGDGGMRIYFPGYNKNPQDDFRHPSISGDELNRAMEGAQTFDAARIAQLRLIHDRIRPTNFLPDRD